MATTYVMVELQDGYGDGYGEVAVRDGRIAGDRPRKVTRYSDGTPMEQWRAELLSAPSVLLIDKGVRVPAGAIRRIIGPMDCDEAIRVRADRYVKNWPNRSFVGRATVDELRSAFRADHRETKAAFDALEERYA